MTVALYDWQQPSADDLAYSLATYGVAADGSEMGTGKTIKSCVVAKRRNRHLVVVCPKAVVADWRYWAEQVGVPIAVCNYDKVRTGKTPLGRWSHHKTVYKGKAAKKVPAVFEWTLPADADLVFDEAHKLSGIDTQQSLLLIAAKRQGIPHSLLSGTLLDSPLKCRALGYSLGLHNLLNFWQWAKAKGVTQGTFGMEWRPTAKHGAAIMEGIRQELGRKFTRIRKADVPSFPKKQVIPTFVETDEMPDEEALDGGRYGYEARMKVEFLKVPGIVERAKELINDAGHSVAIFVNYLGTLNALLEHFPEASVIRGGQSENERITALNNFQSNKTHVALVMLQAGGTGVSLHDLHGRPRSSIICPGNSAIDFLQAIDRIHRAAALSDATIYVAFASGVPVERRIRGRLEFKTNNLSALNDADFEAPITTSHNAQPTNDQPAGALPPSLGTTQPPLAGQPDQRGLGGNQPGGRPQRPTSRPDRDGHRSGGARPARRAGGQTGLVGTLEGFDDDPLPTAGEAEGVQLPAENFVDREVGGSADLSTAGGEPEMGVKILMPEEPAVVPAPAPTTDATGNHVVRKHARCSPSKLKNLEICPSYEGDNDGPVHPVTLRGTAMHEALETGNDSGLLTENDNEELRLVMMCREFQDAERVEGEEVITEPHLKTHDPDVMGFADRVVLEPPREVLGHSVRRARCRDYKMGFNAVDGPENNPQAIAYTVAIFLRWDDVAEVDFAFLIPRLDLVLQHTFKREDLPALKLRLSLIADRVRKLAGKEFNPNNENCLYCGRKATCKALIDKTLTIARGYDDGSKLPLPAVLDPTQIVDPQQIAYALNVASVAESWIEQTRKRAHQIRTELGLEIPGYDLIERQAKREIANVPGTFEIVTKEFGVPPEEVLSACKVSITQLEKVVTDRAGHGEKAKVAEKFTDRLMDEGYLTRGASFHVLQRSRKKAPKKVEAA
jgi:hypothetical protein